MALSVNVSNRTEVKAAPTVTALTVQPCAAQKRSRSAPLGFLPVGFLPVGFLPVGFLPFGVLALLPPLQPVDT